jgi:hypothetical protein
MLFFSGCKPKRHPDGFFTKKDFWHAAWFWDGSFPKGDRKLTLEQVNRTMNGSALNIYRDENFLSDYVTMVSFKELSEEFRELKKDQETMAREVSSIGADVLRIDCEQDHLHSSIISALY